jgi:DNA ligase-4
VEETRVPGENHYVLKNRCPEKGTLNIKEVNDCLDGIAVNNAAKKRDLVRKYILHLLTNMSAIELKWLIRMIVKELKVGLSQASVLSVLFNPTIFLCLSQSSTWISNVICHGLFVFC